MYPVLEWLQYQNSLCMADVTQGGDMVQLGHARADGVRSDGLQNVFTGMGTSRDKTTRTTIKPVTFMGHEDLEGLYAHWLMRRIVDLVADECTREGFEILFGGEGVTPKHCLALSSPLRICKSCRRSTRLLKLLACMAAVRCCFTSMMGVRLTCP